MKYFTMHELTRSVTAQKLGVKNIPTSEHEANIRETVAVILDPLREAWAVFCEERHIPSPGIRVSSGYRGFRLNKSVGGSATSAHSVGYAFDLVPTNGKLAEFKQFCREWLSDKPFDQLISEDENNGGTPRWIHIGYKNGQGAQRRQLLSMIEGDYFPMT